MWDEETRRMIGELGGVIDHVIADHRLSAAA